MANVLILATMNTKGQEVLYLRDRLKSLGASCSIMDLSMQYGDPGMSFDIPATQVAEAGGRTFETVARSRDMTGNMLTMSTGAAVLARALVKKGIIDAVIAVGGCTGTLMITDVMQSLPFGLPKVMISSAAAQPGLASQFL
ncbi:MAG TPA: Tm-1-like ATP-binding domain-containing protein, partial [Methanoregula sp.]|nr:Tm-1-like ATP-binding domain-containing protein [Methanoregula sp.]